MPVPKTPAPWCLGGHEPLTEICDAIVGVYASPLAEITPKNLRSTFAVSQRALEVGMYHHSQVKFEQCRCVIEPEALVDHHVFDTEDVGKIFEVGYRKAVAKMDEIEAALELSALHKNADQ